MPMKDQHVPKKEYFSKGDIEPNINTAKVYWVIERIKDLDSEIVINFPLCIVKRIGDDLFKRVGKLDE